MQILLYISMYSHFPYRVCFQTLDTVFPTYFFSGYLEITTAVVVLCDDLKTYPYRYSVLFLYFLVLWFKTYLGTKLRPTRGKAAWGILHLPSDSIKPSLIKPSLLLSHFACCISKDLFSYEPNHAKMCLRWFSTW